MKKEYGLHFRYRTATNDLNDVGVVCVAASQKDAKQTGKNLERPHDKVWFMGLIPADVAQRTGGTLP